MPNILATQKVCQMTLRYDITIMTSHLVTQTTATWPATQQKCSVHTYKCYKDNTETEIYQTLQKVCGDQAISHAAVWIAQF